jgi:hypothetical protein
VTNFGYAKGLYTAGSRTKLYFATIVADHSIANRDMLSGAGAYAQIMYIGDMTSYSVYKC